MFRLNRLIRDKVTDEDMVLKGNLDRGDGDIDDG